MNQDAVDLAKQILGVRHDRCQYFDGGIFDEQAWELLLQLFVSAHDAEDIDRQQLLDRKLASEASLDRWVQLLIAKDIIVARSWPAGTVTLSALAMDRMEELLAGRSHQCPPAR